MGFDFSWKKNINTDDKKVLKDLGIKILKTIHTEYDMFDRVEYNLYDFSMNGKDYREFVENVETGNGNFRHETIGYYELGTKKPVFYKETNYDHAGIQCIACGKYNITLKRNIFTGKTNYKCNDCGHTSDNEADFYPED